SVDAFASQLDGARESFLNIDGRGAALGIRRAVATMQEQAKDATDAGREAINKSVAELDALAKTSEQRRSTTGRALDDAFSRANLALAQNHLLLAVRAHNQQARRRIGEELSSALGHFQQGAPRLGPNLRQDEQELIQSTRNLASNLVHGVGVT